MSLLKNWKITQDASVKKGVEVISHVLSYDQESIKELKYVCEMLARNNISVDNTCGGHVHLGFDYFEDVFEYATFLTLYSRIENLLYIIGNRSGMTTRDSFSRFATLLNDFFQKYQTHLLLNSLLHRFYKGHNRHFQAQHPESLHLKLQHQTEYIFQLFLLLLDQNIL